MSETIDRRRALAWLASAPFVGRAFRRRAVNRAVVIGAGVLGAATAYRLAKRGAEVTLCEKEQPASGASGKSGAWLNAYAAKLPRHYHDLNHRGTLEWRALEDEVEGLSVNWCSRVEWREDASAASAMVDAIRQQQVWGYPIEEVDRARLGRIAPLLRIPDGVSAGAYARAEGTVHPIDSVNALVAAARWSGAEVRLGCEVTRISKLSGGAWQVETTQGPVEADAVVIAAGVATPDVASLVGVDVPLQDAPGVLAHAQTPRHTETPIIVGPDVALLPYLGDEYRFLGGFTGKAAYSSEKPASERLEAERIMELARQRFNDMEQLELTKVTVGWRPLAVDGYPIVGQPVDAPGIYVMVTHSGFTLAATLSRLATSEILDGARADALAPYRVERFG